MSQLRAAQAAPAYRSSPFYATNTFVNEQREKWVEFAVGDPQLQAEMKAYFDDVAPHSSPSAVFSFPSAIDELADSSMNSIFLLPSREEEPSLSSFPKIEVASSSTFSTFNSNLRDTPNSNYGTNLNYDSARVSGSQLSRGLNVMGPPFMPRDDWFNSARGLLEDVWEAQIHINLSNCKQDSEKDDVFFSRNLEISKETQKRALLEYSENPNSLTDLDTIRLPTLTEHEIQKLLEEFPLEDCLLPEVLDPVLVPDAELIRTPKLPPRQESAPPPCSVTTSHKISHTEEIGAIGSSQELQHSKAYDMVDPELQPSSSANPEKVDFSGIDYESSAESSSSFDDDETIDDGDLEPSETLKREEGGQKNSTMVYMREREQHAPFSMAKRPSSEMELASSKAMAEYHPEVGISAKFSKGANRDIIERLMVEQGGRSTKSSDEIEKGLTSFLLEGLPDVDSTKRDRSGSTEAFTKIQTALRKKKQKDGVDQSGIGRLRGMTSTLDPGMLAGVNGLLLAAEKVAADVSTAAGVLSLPELVKREIADLTANEKRPEGAMAALSLMKGGSLNGLNDSTCDYLIRVESLIASFISMIDAEIDAPFERLKQDLKETILHFVQLNGNMQSSSWLSKVDHLQEFHAAARRQALKALRTAILETPFSRPLTLIIPPNPITTSLLQHPSLQTIPDLKKEPVTSPLPSPAPPIPFNKTETKTAPLLYVTSRQADLTIQGSALAPSQLADSREEKPSTLGSENALALTLIPEEREQPSEPGSSRGASINRNQRSPVNPNLRVYAHAAPCAEPPANSGRILSVRKLKGLSGARGDLPQAAANRMKEWLLNHWDRPYPGREEKKQLANSCSITVKQVDDWMVNARARFWKPLTLEMAKELQQENAARKEEASRKWARSDGGERPNESWRTIGRSGRAGSGPAASNGSADCEPPAACLCMREGGARRSDVMPERKEKIKRDCGD